MMFVVTLCYRSKLNWIYLLFKSIKYTYSSSNLIFLMNCRKQQLSNNWRLDGFAGTDRLHCITKRTIDHSLHFIQLSLLLFWNSWRLSLLWLFELINACGVLATVEFFYLFISKIYIYIFFHLETFAKYICTMINLDLHEICIKYEIDIWGYVKKHKFNWNVFSLKLLQYSFNHYHKQMCAYLSFKENIFGLTFFQLEIFFS